MIVIRLMGGLGNQMFQYAFGRQISLQLNTTLYIDTTILNGDATHTRREYELNVFTPAFTVVPADILDKFETIRKSSVKSRLQKIIPSLFPYFSVHEETSTYNKKVMEASENSMFTGYWQSERYFENVKDVIRKDFRFKPLQNDNDMKLAEKISTSNSLGLHFRRGDYVGNTYHSALTVDYYKTAIEVVRAKINDVQLFVFSDDMDWVKQNVLFNSGNVTYVENHKGVNNYIDMQLMSMCKHNIIANSSFSWWAGWLNNNPGKIIIAPNDWYTDKSIDTSDLIPQGWIRV